MRLTLLSVTMVTVIGMLVIVQMGWLVTNMK